MAGIKSLAHEGRVYIAFEELLDALFVVVENATDVANMTGNPSFVAGASAVTGLMQTLEELHTALFIQHGLTTQE